VVALPVLRPAHIEDAEMAADLMTACYPSEPTDPLLTRYRWEHPPDGVLFGRYIAELEGRPVAFTVWSHAKWDQVKDRYCEIDVWADPAAETDVVDWLVGWMEHRSIEEGAHLIISYGAEDEPRYLSVLAGRGFKRDREDKAWELDLTKHGPRLTSEAIAARELAEKAGVTMTTLEAWPDAGKMRKLHELNDVTRQDIPHTMPIVPQSFENFVERMGAPDVRFDRTWIAVDGSRMVAYSFLRFPPVRGGVWTAYTCCHPEYRGRGLARAVKLQSVAQAVELGVPAIRTANDGENAAMIHINEALGYTPRPGFVGHLKRVQE
jgi:GNAT superfamily N-acetyltransferase